MSSGGGGGHGAYSADNPPDELKQRRGSRVHPEDVEDVAKKANGWKETQLKIWMLFENPQSSRAAFILSVVLLILILISCVAFTLQTIPKFYAADQAVWDGIELVCIVCFTLEYCFRLLASPHRVSFCMAPLNIIDLVAIAPFYVEIVMSATSDSGDVSGLAVFRVIRLARVFRLFKLGRYSDGLKTFANTMARSTRPLAMLVFFMIIAIILFSSAIYYCERGAWDEAQREWWRDQEASAGTGGNFEMLTGCNGTVTTVSGTLDVELADFQAGADSGWVPKLVFDFVEFPTGYISEGSGVAFREQAGTFTATYTDNRSAGDARPTGESVRAEMEFVALWESDSTCRAFPVDDDSQDSWVPTGDGQDCTGVAYSDGMGRTERGGERRD